MTSRPAGSSPMPTAAIGLDCIVGRMNGVISGRGHPTSPDVAGQSFQLWNVAVRIAELDSGRGGGMVGKHRAEHAAARRRFRPLPHLTPVGEASIAPAHIARPAVESSPNAVKAMCPKRAKASYRVRPGQPSGLSRQMFLQARRAELVQMARRFGVTRG